MKPLNMTQSVCVCMYKVSNEQENGGQDYFLELQNFAAEKMCKRVNSAKTNCCFLLQLETEKATSGIDTFIMA